MAEDFNYTNCGDLLCACSSLSSEFWLGCLHCQCSGFSLRAAAHSPSSLQEFCRARNRFTRTRARLEDARRDSRWSGAANRIADNYRLCHYHRVITERVELRDREVSTPASVSPRNRVPHSRAMQSHRSVCAATQKRVNRVAVSSTLQRATALKHRDCSKSSDHSLVNQFRKPKSGLV
jgi:hypothetical protein